MITGLLGYRHLFSLSKGACPFLFYGKRQNSVLDRITGFLKDLHVEIWGQFFDGINGIYGIF